MADNTVDFTVEDIERDPYTIYARLRRESPVAFSPALNSWLVTRWDDVRHVTTNPDLFIAEDDNAPVVQHFGKPAIIHADGAVHQELRQGVAPHYMPKKVAGYIDDLVRPIARDCIEAMDTSKPVDLVDAYFEPISVLTLARSFGVMDVDVATLRDWFHGLALGAINFSGDPERKRICDETKARIDAAMAPIFDRIETEPDSSPLSHMMYHGMPEGERRSRDFIMPSVLVTLLGGMQEPGHGACNTMIGLMENPDQMARVRGDLGDTLRRAVSEGVRWVAPIGTQIRATTRDIEIGGVMIPAGHTVSAVLASANRDEAVFADPDRFDIDRTETGLASFGFGAHFCAGKWLALAQMELAIRILLETFEEISLDPDQPYEFFGWEFRAPTTLFATLR
jgi:cytochrome P450